MADDYFQRLVGQISGFASPGTARIAVNVDIEKIPLKIDCAVNCGLIVNELLLNSLKHAFPDGREGEIRLSLRSTEKNRIELEVADNGIGFPEGPDIETPDSFGLYLVKMLVEELEAKIEISGLKGTHYLIRFAGGE
jgi:two-component sensor histidine kinase